MVDCVTTGVDPLGIIQNILIGHNLQVLKIPRICEIRVSIHKQWGEVGDGFTEIRFRWSAGGNTVPPFMLTYAVVWGNSDIALTVMSS